MPTNIIGDIFSSDKPSSDRLPIYTRVLLSVFNNNIIHLYVKCRNDNNTL